MDDFQFDTLREGIQGIHVRLDRLNGQVGKNQVEIGVLQDRSDRAERQGSLFGAIAGGLVTGIVLLGKALVGLLAK